MSHYEVIIVGAGPAGSSAAYRLAKSGRKVLLIDKCSFPRNKTCAGVISRRLLEILDFPLSDDLLKNRLSRMRQQYRGRFADVTLDDPFAYAVDRRRFDHFLLEQARDQRVEFAQQCSFLRMSRRTDSIVAHTNRGDYSCEKLIGADGVFSRVRRQIGIRLNRRLRGYAVYAEIPKEILRKDYSGTAEIYHDDHLFGYRWVVDKGDLVSIGVAGSAIRFHGGKARSYALKFIREMTGADMDYTLSAGFLPAGCTFWKKMSQNVYLIGDAAGLIDSYSGEGISYAVESGYLIADLIMAGKDRNYQRAVARKFRSRIDASILFAFMMHALPAVFKKRLMRQEMTHSYLQAMTGEYSYCKFLKYLIGGRLLRR